MNNWILRRLVEYIIRRKKICNMKMQVDRGDKKDKMFIKERKKKF